MVQWWPEGSSAPWPSWWPESRPEPPLSSSTPILLLSAWVEGMPSQELQGVTYLDKKGCREPAFLDLVRKLVDERPNAGA